MFMLRILADSRLGASDLERALLVMLNNMQMHLLQLNARSVVPLWLQ